MIKVFKSGFLTFNKNKYKCSFGKNGFTKNKKEGDFKTPIGTFKILDCYYRSDRIFRPKTKLNCIKIKNDMGWCDDPLSKQYNKIIKLPFKYTCEELARTDRLYDILLVISYNMKPVKKNLGSAIFIHIAKPRYKPTEGCIGLKKEDLLSLIKQIKRNTKIKIV